MNPSELPQLGYQPVVLAIAMFSTGPAKQPLFLFWSINKNTRYGLWACEACVLRAKISRGWLEKPILMKKNLLLSSLRSQKGK